MMFAASTMLVSGVTEMTDRVMIWWARMEKLRRFYEFRWAEPISGTGPRFDVGQAGEVGWPR
jgi:hypothetical protein